MEWVEKVSERTYFADYRDGAVVLLHIRMCGWSDYKAELTGTLNGGHAVVETFEHQQELPDFLREHRIPVPPGYATAWEKQHQEEKA